MLASECVDGHSFGHTFFYHRRKLCLVITCSARIFCEHCVQLQDLECQELYNNTGVNPYQFLQQYASLVSYIYDLNVQKFFCVFTCLNLTLLTICLCTVSFNFILSIPRFLQNKFILKLLPHTETDCSDTSRVWSDFDRRDKLDHEVDQQPPVGPSYAAGVTEN